jgi:hypothetical protein
LNIAKAARKLRVLPWLPLLVALAASLGLLYGKQIIAFLGTHTVVTTYSDDVNDGGEQTRRDAMTAGDWVATSNGLGLLAGGRGTVTYHVTKSPGDELRLVLWFYWDQSLHNAVQVSTDGEAYATVSEDTSTRGSSLDLSLIDLSTDEVWIRLVASRAPTSASGSATVLDKVQIATVQDPVQLPYWPGLLSFVIVPILAFVWGRVLAPRAAIGAFAATLGCEIAVSLLHPQWLSSCVSVKLPTAVYSWGQGVFGEDARLALPLAWIALVLVVLCALGAGLRRQRARMRRVAVFSALVLILILGFAMRWQGLQEFQYRQVRPDAQRYMEVADSMHGPYDTGYREPLWIWATKIWFLFVGSSHLNLRLLTLILSLVVVIAAWKFTHDYTGSAAMALLVAGMLATNPYLVYMSVQGLRLELYTICILMLACHSLVRESTVSPGQRTAWLGLWGTLAVLQQLNSLVFVLPVWAYAFWRHKLPWKRIFMPAGVLLVLLGPHLLHNYATAGDPFWSANIHAQWYRNYEFVTLTGTGCNECPSAGQVAADSYSGERISTMEYIFGMHPLGEVVKRTADGYMDIFLWPRSGSIFWRLVGFGIWPLHLVFLFGLLAVLFSRLRGVLLFPVLTVNVLAFLVPIGVDPRLIAHAAPFVAFVTAYGLWTLVVSWPRRVKRRWQNESRLKIVPESR